MCEIVTEKEKMQKKIKKENRTLISDHNHFIPSYSNLTEAA